MVMRSTAQVVETMLDANRLSELCGRAVQATRIRVKPDTSVAVALAARDDTADPVGWARVLWPIGRSKALKAASAAQRRGVPVVCREIGDGLLAQHGGLLADPKLGGHLARARLAGLLDLGAEQRVLRYNPLRRLVVGHREHVIRVSADTDPLGLRFHRFVAQSVPVPERLDAAADRHIGVLGFVGSTDLSRRADPAATRAAGRALAALHMSIGRLPAELGTKLAGRVSDPIRQAAAHAGIFDVLAPELARRVRELAARAEVTGLGEPVLSHGDASPDQVLFDPGTGLVWLTDFDRACLAPPAVDLGSYLSMVDEDTGQALLAGYRAAAGALPDAGQLRRARTRAMLLRLADPLRAAAPDWRTQISSGLDKLAEAIG